jgi:OOP family OmpA-OmpF porin
LTWTFGFNQERTVFEGLWQGILIPNGGGLESSAPFYIQISDEKGKISGLSREEVYKTEFYAIGKFYGERDSNSIHFKHVVYQKKSGSSRTSWCKLESNLTYNKETAYLEGEYKSLDCRNKSGKIILFRSKASFSEEDRKILTHAARDQFVKDLNKGRPAPEIRAIQRENFRFEPIYFDFDKDSIRPKYYTFLESIVEIVDGHTDLRVKVSGNTDAVGSDEYNVDLSKRRAQSIINFFVSKGISADRLVIDFHGEKKPVDSNATPEGKQRNRRVEFSFI